MLDQLSDGPVLAGQICGPLQQGSYDPAGFSPGRISLQRIHRLKGYHILFFGVHHNMIGIREGSGADDVTALAQDISRYPGGAHVTTQGTGFAVPFRLRVTAGKTLDARFIDQGEAG